MRSEIFKKFLVLVNLFHQAPETNHSFAWTNCSKQEHLSKFAYMLVQ